MVTYHPVTLTSGGGSASLEHLLAVLDQYPEYQLIISYPNADTDGRRLIKILDEYRALHPDRVFLVRSLGQLRYLSVLKHCVAVLGNSSSGLVEAPTFGVPTLNIGNRQKGRLTGETIVSCGESKEDIAKAMKKILDPDFQKLCRRATNPYGVGNSSELIVEKLLEYPLDNLVEKSFSIWIATNENWIYRMCRVKL